MGLFNKSYQEEEEKRVRDEAQGDSRTLDSAINDVKECQKAEARGEKDSRQAIKDHEKQMRKEEKLATEVNRAQHEHDAAVDRKHQLNSEVRLKQDQQESLHQATLAAKQRLEQVRHEIELNHQTRDYRLNALGGGGDASAGNGYGAGAGGAKYDNNGTETVRETWAAGPGGEKYTRTSLDGGQRRFDEVEAGPGGNVYEARQTTTTGLAGGGMGGNMDGNNLGRNTSNTSGGSLGRYTSGGNSNMGGSRTSGEFVSGSMYAGRGQRGAPGETITTIVDDAGPGVTQTTRIIDQPSGGNSGQQQRQHQSGVRDFDQPARTSGVGFSWSEGFKSDKLDSTKENIRNRLGKFATDDAYANAGGEAGRSGEPQPGDREWVRRDALADGSQNGSNNVQSSQAPAAIITERVRHEGGKEIVEESGWVADDYEGRLEDLSLSNTQPAHNKNAMPGAYDNEKPSLKRQEQAVGGPQGTGLKHQGVQTSPASIPPRELIAQVPGAAEFEDLTAHPGIKKVQQHKFVNEPDGSSRFEDHTFINKPNQQVIEHTYTTASEAGSHSPQSQSSLVTPKAPALVTIERVEPVRTASGRLQRSQLVRNDSNCSTELQNASTGAKFDRKFEEMARAVY